ncbi:MAG: DUF4328 domain-containing protein [bacterium]|nr:DUF4328 domain-containing protein [SAR324 cluster bacterium]
MPEAPRELPRDLNPWAWAVQLLFGGYGLLLAVAVMSDWQEILLLQAIQESGSYSEEALTESDTRQVTIAGMQVVMYAVAAIAFLLWVYRANRQVRVLGAAGLRFTPGWAVGWWFVPVMNLFRPYQVVKEVWLASAPGAVPEGGEDWKQGRAPGLLGWWWGLVILEWVVGRISMQLSVQADTLDALLAASQATLAVDLLDLVLTALAILVVRGIALRLHERRTAVGRSLNLAVPT